MGRSGDDGRIMELALIAAVAKNGAIGKDGKMPWHIPDDLAHFKDLTKGHPVIMGRRTYESILKHLGNPLPDRYNIILSSQPINDARILRATSINDAIRKARDYENDISFIAGGEQVYRAFLPKATRMHLTELEQEFEGDTYFPSFIIQDWDEVSREPHKGFSFVEYERK